LHDYPAAYQPNGHNRFTIREFLRPLEQTFCLCGMEYLPPFVVHGTHRMNEADIAQAAADYHHVISALRDDQLDLDLARTYPTLTTNLGAILKHEVPA